MANSLRYARSVDPGRFTGEIFDSLWNGPFVRKSVLRDPGIRSVSDFSEALASLQAGSRGAGPTVSAEVYYREVPVLRSSDMGLALVPRPPKLPHGQVSNTHAVECALWLKSWVQHNYGTTIRWSKRSRFDRRRNWRALRDGIELIQQHRISPARWVAFIGEMVLARGQVAPPGMGTVFSRGVVTGQIDFGKAASSELGGQLLRTEKYSRLCEDYSNMMQDLRLSRASTPDAIRAVVAQYFPGHSFRRRVAAVAAEAQVTRDRLTQSLSDYVWIW